MSWLWQLQKIGYVYGRERRLTRRMSVFCGGTDFTKDSFSPSFVLYKWENKWFKKPRLCPHTICFERNEYRAISILLAATPPKWFLSYFQFVYFTTFATWRSSFFHNDRSMWLAMKKFLENFPQRNTQLDCERLWKFKFLRTQWLLRP